MYLGDPKFNTIFDRLLTHDLTGYDVYLMGSILRGRANDIDIIIVGDWDYDRLSVIFKDMKTIH